MEGTHGGRLTDLVRSAIDPGTFGEQHPHPILLVSSGAGPIDWFETTHAGEPTPTPTPTATASAGDVESPRAALHAGTEWRCVHDSGRNPFAGMVTLGRARNNDVILDGGSVSKVHAVLHATPDGWWLEDMRSHNGTLLDGRRLEPGERLQLSEGATIHLGVEVRARFYGPGGFAALLARLRAGGGAF